MCSKKLSNELKNLKCDYLYYCDKTLDTVLEISLKCVHYIMITNKFTIVES